jgi:hypothetical protein
MPFAEGTSVPVGRTRAEIEALVQKYGATRFASGWADDNKAAINFVAHGRLVRFVLPLPTKLEILATLKKTATYHWKTPAASTVDSAHAAELRRRWRCLLLGIKARLELVESGIESFEEAFLSHVVTTDNITVYERIQLEESGVRLLAPAAANP